MRHDSRARSQRAWLSQWKNRCGASGLALTALLAACAQDGHAVPATEVMVEVDAEDSVRGLTSSLRIQVEGGDGVDALKGRVVRLQETLKPVDFPKRVALVPLDGDQRRAFILTATAYDDGGKLVSEARIVSGYIAGQVRYARLLLEGAACLGVSCASDRETCSQGVCGDATTDVSALSSDSRAPTQLTQPDASGDAGAGPADFGPSDGATVSDGASASDPGTVSGGPAASGTAADVDASAPTTPREDERDAAAPVDAGTLIPDASAADGQVASGPDASPQSEIDAGQAGCQSGESLACAAAAGVPSCGSMRCVAGHWDTSTCAAPAEYCQDKDGDGVCSTLCTLQCTGGAGLLKDCAKTDCDDDNRAINPSAPASCTSSTSCVEQVLRYVPSAGRCECVATNTATREGLACGTYSICASGRCKCNGGASCQLGCRVGTVSCLPGPSCSYLQDAPAGTACGTDGTASYCNGSNVCFTNCRLGNPRCVAPGGCVSGSNSMLCAEGDMCIISYLSVGQACITPPGSSCNAQHQCIANP